MASYTKTNYMDPMALVTPAIGLVFWTSVVFILLIFILKKFAWKPILDSVDKRNKNIEDALQSAEKAKKEMENLTADNEKILAQAKAQRDLILKEAREMKESLIKDAKEKANLEAEKIMDDTREQIHNQKMKAITELKNQVADLSIEIAEKIIKSELKDKQAQKKLVVDAMQDKDLN